MVSSVGSLAATLGPEAMALHWSWALGKSSSPRDGHQLDGEVPEDEEGGTFNLGPFVADLIIFMEGSGPLASIHYGSVGGVMVPVPAVNQEAPEGQGCSHVPQHLPDMAQLGGTSSLEHSMCLHIANSHPLFLTLGQYKAYLYQDLVKDMDF